MAPVSVPGMPSWGNQYYPWLPGVFGLSPCDGAGLQALFCWVFGAWNVGRMDDACVRLLECCVCERSSSLQWASGKNNNREERGAMNPSVLHYF